MFRMNARSMAEMAVAGDGHSHSVGFAEIDGFLVANASSWMDYGLDACLVGYLHAV